jgi:undecaprenyl-phosphate 4-deoxy-4-formamido-L-arabinose transferase
VDDRADGFSFVHQVERLINLFSFTFWPCLEALSYAVLAKGTAVSFLATFPYYSLYAKSSKTCYHAALFKSESFRRKQTFSFDLWTNLSVHREIMVNSISVIVPVYGSAKILPDLVLALEPVLKELTQTFEVIFVDDDSPDNAWEVLTNLSAQYRWVKTIRLMRNFGQHNALLCGIRAASHEIIVTMDDDLQHPPTEIPKLLSALTDDIDVVYGPPEKEQHGIWRDLASQMTKMVLKSTMGAENARNVSAFRAFRTHLRRAFDSFQGPSANLDVLLTWGTRRFTLVRVRHDPRHSGKSNYTLAKLIKHALNMITGFSTIPLQLASFLGFLCTGFGILILLWVVGRLALEGGSPPGFPFLASTIAIFSGAQLFALGIMGEYLARIHFRTMDRPTYVTKESEDA